MRVAIVQAAPVYLDLDASVRVALEWIARAAREGATLVAFGETWLPGYPAWLDHCPDAALWNHEATKRVFARLRANSVEVPSATTESLGRAAAEHGVVIVMGVNERAGGTLYNTMLTFDADGRLVRHHRKLVPTYTERLVWGPGDAAGVDAAPTRAGVVGGLVCWEHWMPLARHALHASGERLHIAMWPTVHEMHQVASRQYAFEGRCFVLAAGLLMDARDLPLPSQAQGLVLRGGSAIIGPDGAYVTGPVFDEETLVTADLDLEAIDRELMTLDVAGHYARPDLFTFAMTRTRR